ncbi:hypothetical protein [Agaribacter marinus]|nr:hypothetical protein [Agaribacter marinus]
MREKSHGVLSSVDIILGSAPSFFYVLGAILFVPLIDNTIKFKKFLTLASLIALGALIYEIEQIWTTLIFDYKDILATLAGYLIAILIFSSCSFEPDNATQENE